MNTDESSPHLEQIEEQRLPPPHSSLGGPLDPTPTLASLSGVPASWWVPWLGAFRALLVWAGSVAVLVLLQLLFTVPYLTYKIVATGSSQQDLLKDPWLVFLSVVAILPIHAVTFLMGWSFVTSGGKRPFWKTLGFEWPENIGPGFGLMLSILLALVLFAVAVLITALWGGAKTDIDLLIESSLAARFILAFAAVATAPLVEELIYRGILYPAFERAAGKVISIFAVSFLFAGVHVFQYWDNLAVILVITILSFVLTITRAVTGKLLPAFIIHLVFNAIQSVLIVVGAFVDHELLK